MVGAFAKFKTGTRAPEDLDPKAKEGTKEDVEHDDRCKRICMNDLENIPLGLLVAWGSLLCQKNNQTHMYLVAGFTGFRFLHTVCYTYKLMPWRGLAWFGGLFCTFGMAINGVMGTMEE